MFLAALTSCVSFERGIAWSALSADTTQLRYFGCLGPPADAGSFNTAGSKAKKETVLRPAVSLMKLRRRACEVLSRRLPCREVNPRTPREHRPHPRALPVPY